jgi:hypothetical protein
MSPQSVSTILQILHFDFDSHHLETETFQAVDRVKEFQGQAALTLVLSAAMTSV